MPPDLRTVRDQLPCLATEVYLNTGACGPLTRVAARATAAWQTAELAAGRGSAAGFGLVAAEAARVRAAAGRVIGAGAGQIALTANTTAGVDIVAWGIDWRPGDEIVMPALEHPGMGVPLATVARRTGAVLRTIDPHGDGRDLARELTAAVGPRTRLVALSHVAWSTGALLDVAAAVRAARAVGALVLVDGAQSAGAIPVDVGALGVDAYAFPAHKWLLGPGGLGALWIAPGAMERIDITHTGYEAGTDHGPGGAITLHPGARRHEVSTLPAALLPAWRASLEWIEELGHDWVHARIAANQAAAREALAAVPGVTILTPPGPQAGLVTFTVPGGDPVAASDAMAAVGVIARWILHPPALRVSTGFFTDETDIRRLVEAVTAVATRGGC